MKKRLLLFSVSLFFFSSLSAQQLKGVSPVSTATTGGGQTWAVIAGVSDYQNPDITDLKYAHRDALAFAHYLQSPAGGRVDSSHITLLLNENATAGKFAAALDWLLDVTKEGDLAVIYFSGHGDVERKTISQPGFLLCWDAPARVYTSGGTYALVFLQEIISTISLQTKARVLVVTDACRAGKLAGSDIGGAQATAANLAKQYANEVKIMSCQPDEFSLEGQQWGGGRGVFSYYFLNGITGLADRNSDGTVSLLEIERYLDEQVPAATAPHSQIPMTVGSKSAAVGLVDAATLAALQQNAQTGDLSGSLLASNDKGMESALAKDPSALALYNEFKKALKEGRLLTPEASCAWKLFNQLKDKPAAAPFQGQMRRNLAAALQDEAQQAINDYLKANPAELRKRWGFNERYEKFPEYLDKAAGLLGESHPMYKNLKARAHYFTALNYRLRGERGKTPSLYNLALSELRECLKLEPDAAYAYNELGLLSRRLAQYKEAVAHFENAIAQSPGWVLPWANLTSVYLDLNDYSSAETAGRQAVRLDSTFALAQYNLGLTYQMTGNFPKAKNHYKKAIHYDPQYTRAFFNLGLIYFHENDFERAEQMWMIYHQQAPDDPDGLLNLGETAMKQNQNEKALALFQKALALDPKYSLARLNMGLIYL
ncbi:MAG: tetratricopeptide repeat protein, partial [Thermoanaerobaculia bacterium]|nr:tetratricopeptide repeat protein [Thermoanaerobaculia bacterium]